jgi:Outer membrane protein beta-barrel domain
MKKFTLLMAVVLSGLCTKAQTDSTSVADTTKKTSKADTIRIGNILIIKREDKNKKGDEYATSITMGRRNNKKTTSKVSTNWGIIDFGFSNYIDNTNYANTGTYLVNKPGSPAFGKGDFKLTTGKSLNVNIWFFMQRLSIIKNYVNLKYGLGLEMNNYRYKAPLSYKESGVIPYSAGTQTSNAFIFRDSIAFNKNKLAADYLTVPFMINFNSNPNSKKKGISLSLGASAGYLYSQRNKQKSDQRGKEKNKGEYDLEKFKLAYIAELGLGPVRLYGSYSPKSIYENSLDIKPFTVGFRLSNW